MVRIAKFGALLSFLLLVLSCSGKKDDIPYEQHIVGSLELPHIRKSWGSQIFTEKLPVIIKLNDVVSTEYDREVFGYPLEFLTGEEILRRNVNVYIEFTSIQHCRDEIRVEYEFPVQGAFAGAIFTD